VKSLEQPQVDRLLLPQGENSKSRAELNDRKKHPRLAGADLYVTRLGWNNNNIAQPNPKQKFVKPALNPSRKLLLCLLLLQAPARSATPVPCMTSSEFLRPRLLHQFPNKRPQFQEKRSTPLVLATDAFHTCTL
jgi:hypothetical protein